MEKIRSRGNGFIKQTADGQWLEVGDGLAREKAGQLLRNFSSKSYKSSVQAKSTRRKPLHLQLHNLVLSQPTINDYFNNLNSSIGKEKYTDEHLLEMLDSYNVNILNTIKDDTELVKNFRALDIGTEKGQKQRTPARQSMGIQEVSTGISISVGALEETGAAVPTPQTHEEPVSVSVSASELTVPPFHSDASSREGGTRKRSAHEPPFHGQEEIMANMSAPSQKKRAISCSGTSSLGGGGTTND